MSNVHRKHPVSIAVSMALLAAMAASAMASPRTGAPADNAGRAGSAAARHADDATRQMPRKQIRRGSR